jgi:thiosulfate dehydrogenase [quinone] large subunit
MSEKLQQLDYSTPSEYLLPLRIGVGWMWFDGGLRKLVLAADKVNPSSSSFVLGKLVTFLPHAGFFQPFLKFVLENPAIGAPFLVVYSVLELVIGSLLIIGLFTRLAGFKVLSWLLRLHPLFGLAQLAKMSGK